MRYQTRNRRKYSLKAHLIFVTKYRKKILAGDIADDVKQKFFELSTSHGWEILAMETDKDHIHLLLSYDCTERVCDIVRVLKQESTHMLWQRHRTFLSRCYWKKQVFWSDGYFACSIGEISQATVERYIASQG